MLVGNQILLQRLQFGRAMPKAPFFYDSVFSKHSEALTARGIVYQILD